MSIENVGENTQQSKNGPFKGIEGLNHASQLFSDEILSEIAGGILPNQARCSTAKQAMQPQEASTHTATDTAQLQTSSEPTKQFSQLPPIQDVNNYWRQELNNAVLGRPNPTTPMSPAQLRNLLDILNCCGPLVRNSFFNHPPAGVSFGQFTIPAIPIVNPNSITYYTMYYHGHAVAHFRNIYDGWVPHYVP